MAVDDYNNRPYTALNGLTPTEVLNGKLPANVSFYKQTKEATQHRIIENKKATCCNFSFQLINVYQEKLKKVMDL